MIRETTQSLEYNEQKIRSLGKKRFKFILFWIFYSGEFNEFYFFYQPRNMQVCVLNKKGKEVHFVLYGGK